MFFPLTIVLTLTSPRGRDVTLAAGSDRLAGPAGATRRSPSLHLVGARQPQLSRATVAAETPTAPAASSGSAQAASVAPVVTTSSTRTIQRPRRGASPRPPPEPGRGLRRNAPATFVARSDRSRSNWAIVARARSRIGAQGSESA